MSGIFYPSGHATELLGYQLFSKKAPQGTKKKCCLIFFDFRENDYNVAENTEFGARSYKLQ